MPRIPDVKTVVPFMPTPSEIPALANAVLMKYIAMIPNMLRISTLRSHSFFILIAALS